MHPALTNEIKNVYNQCRNVAAHQHGNGFRYIKDQFLALLDGDPSYDVLTKAAIKLAAEKLEHYPGGPLTGILEITWEQIGLSSTDVTALDTTQREQILAGIMAVCKIILAAEADRLLDITTLDTSLPTGWDTPAEEPESE